jgi:hypothetical protein
MFPPFASGVTGSSANNITLAPGRQGRALRSSTLVTTTHQIDTHQIDCLHPLDLRSILTIGYSERRIKGTTSLVAPDQTLAAEGEALVHSIQFTQPR